MTGEEAHSRTDDDGKPEPVQMAGNFLFMVLDRGLTPIVFEHLRNCFAHSRRHFRNATVSAKKEGTNTSWRGAQEEFCPSIFEETYQAVVSSQAQQVKGSQVTALHQCLIQSGKKGLQLWTRKTVRRGRAATPQRGSEEWGSVR